MIEIRHKDTKEVLYIVEADTFHGANLSGLNLAGADLSQCDLRLANLKGSNLKGADLSSTSFSSDNFPQVKGDYCDSPNIDECDFTGADLYKARFRFVSMRGVNLSKANLMNSTIQDVNLTGSCLNGSNLGFANFLSVTFNAVDLTKAELGRTIFADCFGLDKANGLSTVNHLARSMIDVYTLRNSAANLPEVFLLGLGYVPEEIETFKKLYGKAANYHSCFLSHAEHDEDSALALHLLKDLRNNGVPCWHYEDDLRDGREWEPQIYEAIKKYDKLIVICSGRSIYRTNVVKEILCAIEEEHRAGSKKLFPILLDKHILDPRRLEEEQDKVRAGVWPDIWVRHVQGIQMPDFSRWKDNNVYQTAFKKLLHDLKSEDGAGK